MRCALMAGIRVTQRAHGTHPADTQSGGVPTATARYGGATGKAQRNSNHQQQKTQYGALRIALAPTYVAGDDR